MLKAAHAATRHGIDVVAGYIEPHARPKTAALLNGLEPVSYTHLDVYKRQGKELGGDIKITGFVRFEKGEGLEKRSDNFADEVASMVK